jgi:cation diffusion facilitator family transporter
MNTAEHEKKSAALKSVLAAFCLTAMKIVVGLLSGSLGILAEAAHSGLDFAAALVTFFAVQASSKPADAQHQYGHGKIENLSALFEALLLLITCFWIIKEAVHRLAGGSGPVDASVWAFAVIIVSIIVDVSRSRMLLNMARKHKSQALEADALHFSTDVWSSCVVLGGLVGVKIAAAFPAFKWLEKADSVAALGVAGIVVWVSGRLGLQTINELIDRATEDLAGQVTAAAESVDGVKGCHAVRVRRSGPKVFIDAHVEFDGDISLNEAHRLMDLVEESVGKIIPDADVTVHAEPRQGKPGQ